VHPEEGDRKVKVLEVICGGNGNAQSISNESLSEDCMPSITKESIIR